MSRFAAPPTLPSVTRPSSSAAMLGFAAPAGPWWTPQAQVKVLCKHLDLGLSSPGGAGTVPSIVR